MQCRRFNLAAWYEVSKAHSQLKCPYLTCIWKKLSVTLQYMIKLCYDWKFEILYMVVVHNNFKFLTVQCKKNIIFYFYFCYFSCPWIRIRIQRPDWIRIQSGSGSETLATTQVFYLWRSGRMGNFFVGFGFLRKGRIRPRINRL